MAPSGKFIVFEGVDHCGKTTQIDLAEKWLTARGYGVARFREPGGTEAGERIREVLLDKSISIEPMCEMLLFMASRVQLLQQKILPALNAGQLVLLDRYWYSTYAYQGRAGGLGDHLVASQAGLLNLQKPDLVVVLDGDPKTLAARHTGVSDRIEAKGIQYQQAVREGYRVLCSEMKDIFRVVNAECVVSDVHLAVINALSSVGF